MEKAIYIHKKTREKIICKNTLKYIYYITKNKTKVHKEQ